MGRIDGSSYERLRLRPAYRVSRWQEKATLTYYRRPGPGCVSACVRASVIRRSSQPSSDQNKQIAARALLPDAAPPLEFALSFCPSLSGRPGPHKYSHQLEEDPFCFMVAIVVLYGRHGIAHSQLLEIKLTDMLHQC